MDYLERLLLSYFDNDDDGELSPSERENCRKMERLLELDQDVFSSLPEEHKKIAAEIYNARIIQMNLDQLRKNEEKVKHIPIERRPLVV